MRLSRKGVITLGFAFVVAIILSGVGFAKAYSIQAAYDEQSQQMQLYKDELNEAQASIQENTKYKAMYECIQVERNQLQEQVDELSKWKALGQFTITYYWPGEDIYGSLTSTGVIAQEGKTIAVDPSIIPYGSTVLIDGKEYLAQDCGGTIKGNKIDIFSEYPKQERYQVEIYIKREWI